MNISEKTKHNLETAVKSNMKTLTLEKAIELCDKAAKRYDAMNMPSCAAEEKQMADWLRELKEFRETKEVGGKL